MKKRIICVLVCAVMVLSLFSCAKEELPDNTNEKNTIEKVELDTDSMLDSAVEALNKIPSINLASSGFSIISTSDMAFVPVGNNSKYDSAISSRNKLFETKFQSQISQVYSDVDSVIADAKNSLLSGMYYCDIFAVEQKDLGKFITSGVLLNLNSLAKADFTKDFYDGDAINQAVNYTDKFGVYGDFNKDVSSYYCLYINRSRLTEAGLEMPYSKVADGSWTWDEMLTLARSVCDINTEVQTLTAPSPECISGACLNSGGFCSVNSVYGSDPTLAYGNEAGDKVISLLNSFSAGIGENDSFMGGGYLYAIATVGDMAKITTMSDDWCILPIPKLVASQEGYYTPTASDHTVICVFAGATDTDKLSYALDGLNASSHGGYMTAAYYDELVRTSIRDSSTLDMFDYVSGIKGTCPVIDFTDIYQTYLPTFTALYWNEGRSATEISSENAELFSASVNEIYYSSKP